MFKTPLGYSKVSAVQIERFLETSRSNQLSLWLQSPSTSFTASGPGQQPSRNSNPVHLTAIIIRSHPKTPLKKKNTGLHSSPSGRLRTIPKKTLETVPGFIKISVFRLRNWLLRTSKLIAEEESTTGVMTEQTSFHYLFHLLDPSIRVLQGTFLHFC
nr:unnamed protein product [Callosobruchus analis]